MNNGLKAGIVGFALAGIAAWYGLVKPPTQRKVVEHSDTAPGREEKLQAQILTLAAEVRQLKEATRLQPTDHSPVLPTAQPATSSVELAEIEPEEQQRLVEEHTKQRFDALARGIESEPRDAQWSLAAQQALADAYQGGEFEGTKLKATCKATFCRLDVDVSGAKQPLVVAKMLPLRGPWPAQSMFRIDTETNRIEYYIAREDHELPRVN